LENGFILIMHSKSFSVKDLSKKQPIVESKFKKQLNQSSRLILMNLSENNTKTLYSCIKKLDDILCRVKIISKDARLFLEISAQQMTTQLLPVPPSISSYSYSSILSYLNFSKTASSFTLTPWEFLERRIKKVNNAQIIIEFFMNSTLKRLRLLLPNIVKEYKVDLSTGIEKMKDKVEELYEKVTIRNGEVVVEDFSMGYLAETLKEVNEEFYFIRISREKSLGKIESHSSYTKGLNIRIEALSQDNQKFALVFPFDEICERFSILPQNFNGTIQEILKKVTVRHNRQILFTKESDCLTLCLAKSISKKFGLKYKICVYSIFEYSDLLMVTAELDQDPSQKSFFITEFDTNHESDKIYSNLFKNLTIRKGSISLITRTKDDQIEAATCIQKHFRGYLCRELFKLKFIQKSTVLYRSALKIGDLGFLVVIKKKGRDVYLETHGDNDTTLLVTDLIFGLVDYNFLIKSLFVQQGKAQINSNLLSVYQKTALFKLPAELVQYKKILEKWKIVNNEYSKVSIYEWHENVAILVDTTYKIMKKQEILNIYHELSYECVFDEVSLVNNEVYLDPSCRPQPILIFSRKHKEEVFVSVSLRDHIGRDLLAHKILVFDVTYKLLHNRILIDLKSAEIATGINADFIVAICNSIVFYGLKVEDEIISINLDIMKVNISANVNKIQKVFRGYIVRKNVGKIAIKGNNFLAAVQKRNVSGIEMMLFAYIQQGKIRIEAIDKEYRLVLYLEQNFIQKHGDERKKTIENIIFDSLYIDSSSKMKRLCIDANILARKPKKARKSTLLKNIEIGRKAMRFEDQDYDVKLINIYGGVLIIAKGGDREYRMEVNMTISKHIEKEELFEITEKLFSQILIEKGNFRLIQKS
jgi:hypothetical protein